MQILAYYIRIINLGIKFNLPQGQQPPLKAFTKVLAMDYTTPNYNKEYGGSILGNILNLQLYGYSNAAFTNTVNRKLTSSYIYKLVSGLILYKLNK